MHDAIEAALAWELQRAVNDLGMFFVFLGGQISSQIFFRRIIKSISTDPTAVSLHSACICYLRLADKLAYRYYDQPEYDVFWKMVTDLNVLIYFHPRVKIPNTNMHRFWQVEFAVTLSTHILE